MTYARMWEARVLPGRLDDCRSVLATRVAPAAIREDAGRTEVFVAPATGDQPDRAVLITWWRDRAAAEQFDEFAAGVLDELVARAHSWVFEAV